MWRALAVLMGFVLAAGLFAIGIGAPAEQRVALIIANAKYTSVAALRNPPSDARAIEAALKKAGFQTTVVQNDLTKSGLEQALLKFGTAAAGADVAVVYYAGHGVEVAGNNYLIPVDAKLANAADVDLEAVRAETAITVAQRARRISIVILDACRNNPFVPRMTAAGGQRAVGQRGLSALEPAGEILVAFAAKGGSTAADGGGTNSPFAQALAARIPEPGVEIGLVFRKVRDDVLKATNGQQEPFVYGSLGGREFYFVPGQREAAPREVTVAEWTARIRGLGPDTPRGRYVEAFGQPRETTRVASLGGLPAVDWDRFRAGPFDLLLASAAGKPVGLGIYEGSTQGREIATPLLAEKDAFDALKDATLGAVAGVGICEGKAALDGEAGVVYLTSPPCGLGTTRHFFRYAFTYAIMDSEFDDRVCEADRVALTGKAFNVPKCPALRGAKPFAAFVDWGLNAQAGAQHLRRSYRAR